MANPFQLQALRLVLGLQTHPALPTPLGAPAEHAPVLAAVGGPTSLPAAPGSYATAHAIMEAAPGGAYAPAYDASDSRALTLAAKLFNVTPRDLPPDLRGALTGWLGSAPAGLEGYIRPGCVFVTLHLTLSARCVCVFADVFGVFCVVRGGCRVSTSSSSRSSSHTPHCLLSACPGAACLTWPCPCSTPLHPLHNTCPVAPTPAPQNSSRRACCQ